MSNYVDSFEHRVANIKFGNGPDITFSLRLSSSTPIYVTNDDEMDQFTFEKTPVLTYSEADVGNITDTEYTAEHKQNRFKFIAALRSIINDCIVGFWYDYKYQDILIIPNTTYLRELRKGEIITLSGTRLGVYTKLKEYDRRLELGVDQNTRNMLPEPNDNAKDNMFVRLLSIPGTQTPAFTQDANTYEDMINDRINLKRSQRQMSTVIELGTLATFFKNNSEIDVYLLFQYMLRGFAFTGLPGYNGNNKLYINLSF